VYCQAILRGGKKRIYMLVKKEIVITVIVTTIYVCISENVGYGITLVVYLLMLYTYLKIID
jgi:hypothetical protein